MTRALGAAFLLQAVTSLVSALILQIALVVPGNVTETMTNIAARPALMRLNVLGDMVTAGGIVFLGVMLFVLLRRWGQEIALLALALYVLEAGLLTVSKVAGLALLAVSQDYATSGQPATLLAAGELALAAMNASSTLALVPFGVGAPLFYYLLNRSELLPRAVSLWGLLSVALVLIATVSSVAGYPLPFVVYVPYVPFEFVVGVWLLVRPARQAVANSSPR